MRIRRRHTEEPRVNSSTTSPASNGTPVGSNGGDRPTPRGVARNLSKQLCRGFRCHDEGDRSGAVEAFWEVDRGQFPHLDRETTRESARAYVDALWAKDELERQYARDGDIVDREGVEAADWSPVRDHLRDRATAVGMPEAYARLTTEAWREHKAGGDYWTPTLRAQVIEVREATGDQAYPRKRSDGCSGPGPLAARYLVGVELHDMHAEHHWASAVEVMTPYFEGILLAQEGRR